MDNPWVRNAVNTAIAVVALLLGIKIGYEKWGKQQPTTDRLEAVSVDEFTPPSISFE